MDYTSLMSMLKSQTYLNSQRYSQLPVQGTSLLDKILECVAFYIFLHNIAQILILSIAKNLHNIRMVKT